MAPQIKRKSRGKINVNRVRVTHTYDLAEIATLFEVSIHTVRRWRRQGLPTLNDHSPYLVYGLELKGWLLKRQKARKRPCKAHEFYCMGSECRTQRSPKIGSVIIRKTNSNTGYIEALCSVCETKIRKGYATAQIATIEATFESYKSNVEDLAWYRQSPLNVTSST